MLLNPVCYLYWQAGRQGCDELLMSEPCWQRVAGWGGVLRGNTVSYRAG
ncbi:hypothetical protein [Citrobacter sp. JGM124]|nr:hypothetical protein [Citrobacter sp. JGM124]MBS0849016.1 hypothetical protein [Citrobacter sp. JGM124]